MSRRICRNLLESQVPVSTLLHMLGGLDTPTKGSVTVGRERFIQDEKEDIPLLFSTRRKSVVFQAFNLVSSVNVWENIVLPLGLDGRKWMKRM